MINLSKLADRAHAPRRLTVLLYLFFAAAVFCPAVSAEDGISLSASLSSSDLSLDSNAVLTITVNGSRAADVEIPEVADLIFHRRGQSSQMRIVNGSFSSSITTTYIIQPLKEGAFTIPPLRVKVDSVTLTTEPLTLTVRGQADKSTADAPGSEESRLQKMTFLTISRLKDKAYTGELLPVEIKAYFLRGVRAEVLELPQMRGEAFVIAPFDSNPRQTTEVHGGRQYSVLSWQTTVSPIKEGEYELIIDLDATLLLPERTNRSRHNRHPLFDDDFLGDDIFDSFFDRYQKKKVALESIPHSLAVAPLPDQGKPAGFSGAVGNFDFSVSAKPTHIQLGDPVTLTMTISGQGNFDRVAAPAFPESSDWKTYSAASTFNSKGSDYQGEKVFEQAVVVNNPGIKEIPPLHFSYFDPQKEIYVTRATAPLPLVIKEAQALTAARFDQPPAIAGDEGDKPGLSSAPSATLRLTPGRFVTEIAPVYASMWFILTAAFCTLVLICLMALTLRRNYRQKNLSQVQRKKLNKDIEARLSILQQNIDSNDGGAFLNNCRRIIQLRLGMDWKLEPSAITLTDLKARLSADSPLIRIFAAAEQQAYGGTPLSQEELRDYLEMMQNEQEEKE